MTIYSQGGRKIQPRKRTTDEIALEMTPDNWRHLMWWLANSRTEMFCYIDAQHHEKFGNIDWLKCVSYHEIEMDCLEPIEREWWDAFVEEDSSGH